MASVEPSASRTGGLEPGDVGGEARAVALGDAEFAGGNIDPAEREAALLARQARARDREQIVVARGIEQRVLGERARRDEAHDIAPHHALSPALARLGGVLDLLADRDPVPERDQAIEIFVGAFDWHPAHRDVAVKMFSALGEHNPERARGELGVLEKKLVEVAHPVEQQAIRIGSLDLDILLHHRGDAARRIAGSGGIGRGVGAGDVHGRAR